MLPVVLHIDLFKENWQFHVYVLSYLCVVLLCKNAYFLMEINFRYISAIKKSTQILLYLVIQVSLHANLKRRKLLFPSSPEANRHTLSRLKSLRDTLRRKWRYNLFLIVIVSKPERKIDLYTAKKKIWADSDSRKTTH